MSLRVLVHEARTQSKPVETKSDDPAIDRVLGKGHPIQARPGYTAFSITFPDYLAFIVRNESYAQPEDHEDYSKLLRTYENSRFLQHLRESTFGPSSDLEQYRHYGLICLNHVFDVACRKKPIVTARTIEPNELENR